MRPTILILVLLTATGVVAGEEVRLTLEECLARAIRSAPALREGRIAPPIAETFIGEAKSEFEHLLTFQTAGGKSHSPVSSQLGGADVLEQQTFAAEVAVGGRLRTGATYSIGYQTSDLLTNSAFFTVRPAWTNSLSFRVEQPVLRAGGWSYNTARTRIAEADLEAARADYEGLLNSTLSAVERAYWNLVYERADLEVKRHSLTVARELQRVSSRRLAAGAGTRIEVVQADAGVAGRETELILAEHRVANAEDLLRSFVFPFSAEPQREVRIVPRDSVGPPPPAPPERLEDRLLTAFANRPDVKSVEQRLRAAGIRLEQRENELLPQLNFFGRVGLTGLDDEFPDSNERVFAADFPAWEVGLALEIPLGNRGARSRRRRSILERARTAASFESLKNQVIVEVRASLRAAETARREIDATHRAALAARAQFEAEQDRVAGELSTNYQLLEVEQDLSEARSRELLALVEFRKALVNLEEASGTYLASRGLVTPAPDVSEILEPREEE